MYIRKISISNYRSLKKVEIGDMTPITVFYGANDSGKSNILAFLELLFSSKLPEDMSDIGGDGIQSPSQRPGVFWRGGIENFGDNFFRNQKESINYSVLVRFQRKEIKNITQIPKSFLQLLPKNRLFDHLVLTGNIIPDAGELAKMTLQRAEFNQKVFFSRKPDGTPSYLSEFSIPEDEKLGLFNSVIEQLNNNFLRVPPSRYLTSEEEILRGDKVILSSNSFKNWLLQTSLNRIDEEKFKSISEQFNKEPFKHGRLSLARTGQNEIEIFVEDDASLKLPIGRKGSGVQQILMLLSYVAQSKSSIIGIEELEMNLSPTTQLALFNSLKSLVETEDSSLSQILLTTHSYHLARRNDVQRRGVWIKNGITFVKKPSEAEMIDFFK